MGHIILDGITSHIFWFFLFFPHGITFDSLSQDGRHPWKLICKQRLTWLGKVGAICQQIPKNNSPMIDVPQMSISLN